MSNLASDSTNGSSLPDDFQISENLQDLLDQWETLRKAGTEISAEQLCGDDETLRTELREHLLLTKTFSRFTETPIASLPNDVGPYRIVRELGNGGHAVVYLAKQSFPDRQVALKLLRSTPTASRVESRFRLEIQLLATLRHHHIANIYDAGVAEINGSRQLYYTMEYVDGNDVLHYVRQQESNAHWTAQDTIKLCIPFCEALAESHRAGIVHRDIKPANMLIDSQGTPKLIDFGLARTGVFGADEKSLDATLEHWVGTRRYMSPEQFGRDSSQIDARTDVYAMALVIYELLVDCLPYPIDKASIWQTAREVKETSPTPIRKLDPNLSRDLDTILQTALAKDPNDRFPSIKAFAEDLKAYLDGRPIKARRTTGASALWKLCIRHRAAAITAAMTLIVIISLAVVASVSAIRSIEKSKQLEQSIDQLTIQKKRATESKTKADAYAKRAERTAFNQRLLRLATLIDDDPNYVVSQLEDDSLCPSHLRGLAWECLHRSAELPVVDWQADSHSLVDVALSSDGKTVVTSGSDGITAWDIATQSILAASKRHPGSANAKLAFDDQGRKVMFAQNNGDAGYLDITNNQSSQLPRIGERPLSAFDFVADRESILVADRTGMIQLRDAENQEVEWTIRVSDTAIISLTTVARNSKAAAASDAGEVIYFDWESGEILERHQAKPPSRRDDGWARARFNSDLSRVVFTSRVGTVSAWDIHSATQTKRFANRGLLPDGLFIPSSSETEPERVVISGAGQVDIWSEAGDKTTLFRRNQPYATNDLNENEIQELAARFGLIAIDASIANGRLAIALRGGLVVIKSLKRPPLFEQWERAPYNLSEFAFSSTSEFLAGSSRSGALCLYSTKSGQMINEWHSQSPVVYQVAFHHEAPILITRGTERGLVLWDPLSGALRDRRKMPSFARFVQPVGDRVYVGAAQNQAVSLELEINAGSATIGEPPRDFDSGFLRCSYDPSSSLFATLEKGGVIKIRSAENGLELEGMKSYQQTGVHALAFVPGGQALVVGNRRGLIRVLRIPDFHLITEQQPNPNRLADIDFSPDGRVMASGHSNGELLLWDVKTWEPQLSLTTGTSPIQKVKFSPNGDLAVAIRGGQILAIRNQRPTLAQP